jgi:voltage-gated potassium channel
LTPRAGNTSDPLLRRQRRRSPRVVALYVLALLKEFRFTLGTLGIAVLIGGLLFAITPVEGVRPDLLTSLYGGWMALLAQPIYNPPPVWYLTVLCAVYPLLGAVLIGEGVVRLALLMMSRRRGEKEWFRVMISTYRDHVIVCGLGHLGVRVLEQLIASGATAVVVERRRGGRFVARAAELGVPILIRDMKEDQALIDAGIAYAKSIVIATNDAMANLEVALDARRMNPKIRIVMRMFDEQVAHKISDAMDVDEVFSSSTLAAPLVAKMAMEPKSM